LNLGLDTSVVVRVLSGDPENLALAALRFLRKRQLAGDRFLVSDLVLAETYHAFQHHYGASKRETLAALRDFLASPGIEGSGEVPEVLATPNLESAKPGFIDRVIHRDYLRAGAEQVVTFETAGSKLQQIRLPKA
jgi:predicted nucleic-acid-binding protein